MVNHSPRGTKKGTTLLKNGRVLSTDSKYNKLMVMQIRASQLQDSWMLVISHGQQNRKLERCSDSEVKLWTMTIIIQFGVCTVPSSRYKKQLFFKAEKKRITNFQIPNYTDPATVVVPGINSTAWHSCSHHLPYFNDALPCTWGESKGGGFGCCSPYHLFWYFYRKAHLTLQDPCGQR